MRSMVAALDKHGNYMRVKVNMDVIISSGKFVVIIKKLCQRILDGEDVSEEWKTSVVVPIFKEKV